MQGENRPLKTYLRGPVLAASKGLEAARDGALGWHLDPQGAQLGAHPRAGGAHRVLPLSLVQPEAETLIKKMNSPEPPTRRFLPLVPAVCLCPHSAHSGAHAGTSWHHSDPLPASSWGQKQFPGPRPSAPRPQQQPDRQAGVGRGVGSEGPAGSPGVLCQLSPFLCTEAGPRLGAGTSNASG